MHPKRYFSILLLIAISLSACVSGKTATTIPTLPASTSTSVLPTAAHPVATATVSVATATQSVATATTPPTAVPPTAVPPTATQLVATATSAPSGSGLPDISSSVYLDDRSTPAALMLSYFNAVNRREYLRAYSYYEDPTTLGTLAHFSDGYSSTQSVSAVVGNISNGAAAGSVYYTVPMVLNATTTANAQQRFAACYVLRLGQPANYGAPPITPMSIQKGTAKSVSQGTSDADALASACPEPDFPTNPNPVPPAVEQIGDLSPANYIDNRTDAVTLMSSFLNALNSKEYVRA